MEKNRPMPIARMLGSSTRRGKLRIGPAARPLDIPSAIRVVMTASVRVATINSAAVTKKHDAIIASWRPVRSARKPPRGTETAESQSTMLMADPAAVIDQPCSTSIDGPKLKIIAKPILYSAQIDPAQTPAIAARRPKHPLHLPSPPETPRD